MPVLQAEGRAISLQEHGYTRRNLFYFDFIDLFGGKSYYAVQALLSSRLLSKNLKIKIYETIMLPVVPYGCQTWTLTLREECRLRVFENRILR